MNRRHWTLLPPVAFGIYVLVRLVLMVVHMFPYRMAPALGRALGAVLRRADRRHLRIARKNLERSPGLVRPEEIPAFLDRVYEYTGITLVELFMVPRLLARGEIRGTFRFLRTEQLDRCLAGGKGAIAVIGHLGNYELGGVALNALGRRLHSLARPVVNPHLDRYLTRFRTLTGQEIISTENPLGGMIRTLRGNGILVIEIDQDAKRDGVLVDFFGRKASAHRSPALFAIKYGAPVVLAECWREAEGNVCLFSDPIDPAPYKDRPDGVEALTQEITARFEAAVRRHPEQWFWVYDRWRGAEKLAEKEKAHGS